MVVVDDNYLKELENLIFWIGDLLKINIKLVIKESLLNEDITLDIPIFEKIRWISSDKEIPRYIFSSGVTVDDRDLMQSGSQELLCWVKEQSISITNHRYGNVGAGPQPFIDW